MNQEEKLFGMFKEAFDGYAPEAPAHIYSGIEKSMATKGFWSWSWNSLNVWYLALVLTGGAIAWTSMSDPGEAFAKSATTAEEILTSPVLNKAHSSIEMESVAVSKEASVKTPRRRRAEIAKMDPISITQKSADIGDENPDSGDESKAASVNPNDSTVNNEASGTDSNVIDDSKEEQEDPNKVWKFKKKKTVDPDEKK